MQTIQQDLKTFKTKIEKSPELQLDFLICEFLHKTPGEVAELERQGLFTVDQKLFLQAGIAWKLENHIGGCPLL